MAPEMPPAVSVVVATYERAHRLPGLFDALAQQSLGCDRFEVVVVDDASRDMTAQILGGLVGRAPMHVTLLRASVNGGPAVARNLGWRAARAPVIAFTDDDCLPTANWLEAGLRAMGGFGRIVVGRVQPNPEQVQNIGLFSRTLAVESTAFMQTCNVFYRRDDLELAGGFDVQFRTGEDIDLGLRVMQSGPEAVFSAEALVYHDVEPSRWGNIVRDSWRWRDLPLVIKRHPTLRRTHVFGRVFYKSSHPLTLLALLGLILTPSRSHYLLLVLPWLGFRLKTSGTSASLGKQVAVLGGQFAIDTCEVATMVRGSLHHRTFLL